MVKNKRKTILIFLIIVAIIISIVVIKILGLKTIEINETTLEQGYDTTAFIIQEEGIMHFNGTNNIDLKVKEGIKVPIDSIIGNSNNLIITNQDALDLDIIDWKIENEMHQEQSLFDKDLEKVNKEIKHIEKDIESAEKSNEKDKVKELSREKLDLEYKKQIIEGAFRFAFTDRDTLNELKNKLTSDTSTLEGSITPKKLGISYPGYIFFHKDGYENILHQDLLGNITPQYFLQVIDYVKKENQAVKYNNNEQLLKFVNDTKMYIVVRVPQSSFLEEEEKLVRLKTDIEPQWKENGQTSEYSFMEDRRDILQSFPKIKIQWEDKIISGFLVDSNDGGMNEEKVLTIKLDTYNHSLVGKRQLDIHIYDNKYRGYILPKNAITKRDGKSGVILLGKANEEKFVEVTINKELDEVFVLDPKENENLKSGDQIIENPKS